MKAVFLANVEIESGRRRMSVNKGDVLSAEDDGDFYILCKRRNGSRVRAPKSEEGKIYKIVED